MRRLATTIAPLATGLLVLAAVMPATAAEPTGYASGSITWTSPSGPSPRASYFSVQDGLPVPDSKPRNTSTADGGTYRLFTLDGSLTLAVSCVRVGSGWAEFAGVVTRRSGVYVANEAFLVSVKDSGPGAPEEIGMKSHGFSINAACYAALDDKQFPRQGITSGGDIVVGINS